MKFPSVEWRNKKIYIPLALLGFLLISYLFLGFWHFFKNNQTYPSGSQLYSYDLSGLSATEAKTLIDNQADKTQVVIKVEDIEVEATAAELGLYANLQLLEESINSKKLASALLPFVYDKNVDSPIILNTIQFSIVSQAQIPESKKPPVNANYSVKNNEIIVTESKPGNTINPNDIADSLTSSLLSSQSEVRLDATLVESEPAIGEKTLENLKVNASDIFKLDYQISDEAESYPIDKKLLLENITTNETADNLVLSNTAAKVVVLESAKKAQIKPIDEVTSKYLSGKPQAITTKGQIGREVSNTNELAEGLSNAIDDLQSFNGQISYKEIDYKQTEVTVDDLPKSVTYTYKIITWGTTNSNLEEFASLVAETLADARGWGQAGVSFKRVTSGGDFDIVLSQAEELPKRYPQWCDSYYSCRVGRYVIINEDRWIGATAPWNNAGGSLRDYRHMVVNHEVGHRLGRGHEYCSAPGNLAPVMQQQSISLQGCKFNPWPLEYEINLVKKSI